MLTVLKQIIFFFFFLTFPEKLNLKFKKLKYTTEEVNKISQKKLDEN